MRGWGSRDPAGHLSLFMEVLGPLHMVPPRGLISASLKHGDFQVISQLLWKLKMEGLSVAVSKVTVELPFRT